MKTYKVTRFGQDAKTYTISDASEIEYIDNDCVGDFKRGLYDDAVDRLIPGSQITIKTHCGSICVLCQSAH